MKTFLLVAVLLGLAGGAAGIIVLARHRASAAREVGRIAHPGITEASGIIASRRHPGVYWTHNDRGNIAALYAMTQDGRSLAEYRVDAKNGDWEDIATDDEGRLYIGQIGNNDGTKTSAKVLILDEPDPSAPATQPSARLAVLRTVELAYPRKPFDSEAMLIHRGQGYLISKVSKKHRAALYRFALEERDEPVVLEPVVELPIRSPVTAADLSPDGGRLAVLSQAGVDVFQVDNDPARAATAPRQHFPLAGPHDFEGCCFSPDGIVLVAETREIRLIPNAALESPVPDGQP